MKKEYLTPDVWVFDFAAACMQEAPQIFPTSTEYQYVPSRRGVGEGPAFIR